MARFRRKNVPGRPRAIGDAIWSLVRSHIGDDTIRLTRIREVWPAVAGPALAAQAWPRAVSGGEAVIEVHDSQWLHELTYMRQALAKKLGTLAPEAGIDGVKLRLANKETPPPPTPEPTAPPLPPRPALLPAEPPEATVAAINAVEDDELRHLIAAARVVLGRPSSGGPPRS